MDTLRQRRYLLARIFQDLLLADGLLQDLLAQYLGVADEAKDEVGHAL